MGPLSAIAGFQRFMARLLLIDDEDSFREILAAILAHAGHTVMEATDGRKALALCRTYPADLVITDLVMPDYEGIELIALLRRERPALPVIAMSGGLLRSADYLALATKFGVRRTFYKPFPPAALLRAIEQLLPSPPGPGPAADEDPAP